MIIARQSHSMICNNNVIYVVGGYQTNTCEKYDFSVNKWVKLPNMLTDERQNTTLVVHGNYLYAFFGYKIGSYLDTIERINVKSNRAKWESVPYKNPENLNLKLIQCGVILIGDSKIWLFGGKTKDSIKKDTIEFDLSNNTFYNTGALSDEGFFQESTMFQLTEGSYGNFDNDKGDHFLRIELN
jgi:hypothetical protein